MRTRALAPLLVLAAAACSDAELTATPAAPVAAALQVSAGDGQRGTAGTALPAAPRVRLVTAAGDPVPAAVVTFAVAAGGGSLTGSIDTTDAAGYAAVASWVLGPTAGTAQQVTATAATFTATFTATAVAGAPSAAVALATNPAAGTVGDTVAPAVGVRVRDANQNPVAGAVVRFALAANAGTLAADSAVTDSAGVAYARTWRLGTASGAQTLTATATGATPVTVSVAVGVGPVSTLAPLATNATAGVIGETVAPAMGVRAVDAYQNPVAAVVVRFAVGAQSGTVASDSALTDADGVARAGAWRLGTSTGAQTLTASAGPAITRPLTVTASAPAGCTSASTVIGATVTAAWAGTDCFDGPRNAYYDQYVVTSTQQLDFTALLSGHRGRRLRIFDAATDFLVGAVPAQFFANDSLNPLELQYILPAGTYQIRPYTTNPDSLGAYTLSTRAGVTTTVAEQGSCRPIIFVQPGITRTDAIDATTDCVFPANSGGREDRYVYYAQAGTAITASVTSTGFAPLLVFREDWSPTAPTVASQARSTPGTVTVSYTTTYTGFYELIVARNNLMEGAYTLTFSRQP